MSHLIDKHSHVSGVCTFPNKDKQLIILYNWNIAYLLRKFVHYLKMVHENQPLKKHSNFKFLIFWRVSSIYDGLNASCVSMLLRLFLQQNQSIRSSKFDTAPFDVHKNKNGEVYPRFRFVWWWRSVLSNGHQEGKKPYTYMLCQTTTRWLIVT